MHVVVGGGNCFDILKHLMMDDHHLLVRGLDGSSSKLREGRPGQDGISGDGC